VMTGSAPKDEPPVWTAFIVTAAVALAYLVIEALGAALVIEVP